MLEDSRSALAAAIDTERKVAEIVALRYLASELEEEEDLIPAERAAETAQAHRTAGDETWQRAVFGILLGLRSAEAQGFAFKLR